MKRTPLILPYIKLPAEVIGAVETRPLTDSVHLVVLGLEARAAEATAFQLMDI